MKREYAHSKLTAKRIARGVKRAKRAKRRPDPWAAGFLAATAIMEQEGKSIQQNLRSLQKFAAEFRRSSRLAGGLK